MPFYDKTIELAFISHPQKDHFGGYEYIIDRYKLKLLFLNQVNIDSKSYGSLVDKVNKYRKKTSSLSSEAEKKSHNHFLNYIGNKALLILQRLYEKEDKKHL